ncbi:MAG: 2-oxo acid dehydrogenase subunit E2 [Actinobacteria bacterium]|nr:2-oxo acid dehydrogenase subunit E2 [Actinomycetota bacterium]
MADREFLLPDLGEGLEEAEVASWKVAEGERVGLNQPLVEVDTAKALVEIPSPFAGVVRKLHAAEGDVVKVGSPLVTIDDESGLPSADAGGAEPAAVSVGVVEAPEEAGPRRRAVLVGYGVDEEEQPVTRPRTREPTPAGGRRGAGRGPVRASPVVRRLAREMGVDLSGVQGTGPGGRITREDVERSGAGAQAADAPEPEGEDRSPVRGPRRLIAEKMARSWREIPHVSTFLTVDATWLLAFREEIERDAGIRVSPLTVIVRALAEVCRDHPKINASFDAERGEVVLHRHCNVGVATDTERGLLVPVARGVRSMGITRLGDEIRSLVEAARSGRIEPERLSGGTITVTNVGTFGSEYGTPIINHPEAAILAVGVIEPRALVVEATVQARPAVTLSLTFDHRLLDGAEAGRALRALADLLESPFRLGALPR